MKRYFMSPEPRRKPRVGYRSRTYVPLVRWFNVYEFEGQHYLGPANVSRLAADFNDISNSSTKFRRLYVIKATSKERKP